MYVDLHAHLRGTILPVTAARLAQRNEVRLDDAALRFSKYTWRDFPSFLRAYDEVASLVRTPRDLEEVAYEHLSRVGATGTIYVELMLSPPHEQRSAIPYGDQLAALDAAADRALEETGIECRVIATAVRHLGPVAAINAARTAVACLNRRLVGFGLTGNELVHDAAEFSEAFAIARDEGLKLTAHAGEHLPPETILPAVEALGLNRIGHGIRAVESPPVIRTLADLAIPLEICISSNIALGVSADVIGHPIVELVAAGCAVTLGTDDPALFSTTPAKEYALAKKALSDPASDGLITRTAIKAAFCDEDTKARLLAKC